MELADNNFIHFDWDHLVLDNFSLKDLKKTLSSTYAKIMLVDSNHLLFKRGKKNLRQMFDLFNSLFYSILNWDYSISASFLKWECSSAMRRAPKINVSAQINYLDIKFSCAVFQRESDDSAQINYLGTEMSQFSIFWDGG